MIYKCFFVAFMSLLLLPLAVFASCNYALSVVDGVNFADVSQNSTVSNAFTVQNTGNCTLTNLVVSSNAESKFNARFNGNSTLNLGNISVGLQKSGSVTVSIPKDEPVGNHSIGFLSFNSDEYTFSSLINMNANVKGKLLLVSINVDVDGEKDDNIDEHPDGYEIDKRPTLGDEVIFTIRVKNDYDTNDDEISINDISMKLEIDNLDIDEESEQFDLNEQNTETADITFNVPDDADQDEYDVDITIKGKDDDGIRHEINRKFVLSVRKEGDDLRITKFNLTKNILSCDRKTNLIVEVTNYGEGKERDVVYKIKNSDLGVDINQVVGELKDDLEEDDSRFGKTYTIDATNAAVRLYTLQIDVYRNTDDWESRKVLNLDVRSCATNVPAPPTEEEADEEPRINLSKNVTSVLGGGVEKNVTTGVKVPVIKATATKETSLMDKVSGNLAITVLIILGNLVVLLIILLIVAHIIIKKRSVDKEDLD